MVTTPTKCPLTAAKHEVCPNCLKLTEVGHASSNCDSGFVCGKPAPAASELPEAVADAIDAITDAYNETDDGYGCAAALEAWARSQTQPVDASAVYDEGFADGVALQKRCEAQPSAVGMTPELEMVLKAASLRCGYLLRGAQTKTKLTESRRLSTAIAAVRAKLAAMREPLWMLREEHEAETADLRARLEAAEARAAKWVNSTESPEEFEQLIRLGWKCAPSASHYAPNGAWMILVVPSVPLPEMEP